MNDSAIEQAKATLVDIVRDKILTMTQEMPSSFGKLSEAAQRAHIEKCANVATACVQVSCDIIAADGRTVLDCTIGKIDVNESLATAKSFVDAKVDAIVLDTVVSSTGNTKRYGGTGLVGDWDVARELVKAIPTRVFLAGGIKPANVQQAIQQVHPYGIDLCSGVEATPGAKDPQRIDALMKAVRAANEENK